MSIVAQRDAEHVHVAHDLAGVQLEHDALATLAGGGVEVTHDDFHHVEQGYAPLVRAAGIQPREVEQLLGQTCAALDPLAQPAERGVALHAVSRLQRELGLGEQGGHRGAQLVRGVGDEAALALQRTIQPLEKLIERLHEGRDLAGQPGSGQGGEIKPLAATDGRLDGEHRAQRPAHHRPQRQRQQHEQDGRGAEAQLEPAQALGIELPMRPRGLHVHPPAGVAHAVDAPALAGHLGVGEPGGEVGAERLGRRTRERKPSRPPFSQTWKRGL